MTYKYTKEGTAVAPNPFRSLAAILLSIRHAATAAGAWIPGCRGALTDHGRKEGNKTHTVFLVKETARYKKSQGPPGPIFPYSTHTCDPPS
ncbi:uncharacterized protein LY79DRAFT_551396 [Colletotrichum navitas]|uniref:Uncharacterized protein n=1 Tax=Colletotrichum navitas TaxID=681940 RepID=A0AAD8V6I8_9PEZI|nr:uncharacterized protein LY79DRAFT_551396 [Colletotrichum navitas]KAK1593616.1 hypothetical protein LY79DRAFT_551396 [Colletotrichum navitas]